MRNNNEEIVLHDWLVSKDFALYEIKISYFNSFFSKKSKMQSKFFSRILRDVNDDKRWQSGRDK